MSANAAAADCASPVSGDTAMTMPRSTSKALGSPIPRLHSLQSLLPSSLPTSSSAQSQLLVQWASEAECIAGVSAAFPALVSTASLGEWRRLLISESRLLHAICNAVTPAAATGRCHLLQRLCWACCQKRANDDVVAMLQGTKFPMDTSSYRTAGIQQAAAGHADAVAVLHAMCSVGNAASNVVLGTLLAMLCDFRTAEVRGDELHSGVATLLIQAVSAQAQPRPVSVAAAGKVIDDAMVSTIATCHLRQPFLPSHS